jgi:hypothetical protein
LRHPSKSIARTIHGKERKLANFVDGIWREKQK